MANIYGSKKNSTYQFLLYVMQLALQPWICICNKLRRQPQWPRGLSPAEIVGSNPTGGMDVCLLWVSCVVR